MKRVILLILILATFTVSAQELHQCDTTRSYWIFGQDSSAFSVKLLGNAMGTERSNVIALNNYPLQSVVVDRAKFTRPGEDNSDLKVMIRYAMSEAEYLSGIFKKKLNIRLRDAPISANRSVLIWFFEMPPEHSQEVKVQVFANLVVGDKIFGLASPQFKEQKFEDVFNRLMDVISTVKKIDRKDGYEMLCDR